jgi:ABC-2 type transport system ATP-binding protein
VIAAARVPMHAPKPMRASPVVARLEAARRSFGDVVALDGVDLELRGGEILAVLGPNGAGKSTAVAALLGLRRLDAGRARLFGSDPREPAARRRVGAVLQELGFPPGLRVREAVDLVRAHFPDSLGTREALDRLDLGPLADRDAAGLSGGQRRRLAVALALVGRPRALFLDEPTAGMDATVRRAVLRDVAGFAADGGAVLLTTQQLRDAEEVASRVVLLRAGRVALDGSLPEMRRHGGVTRISFRATRLPSLAGILSSDSRGGRHVVWVEDADRFVADLVRSGAPFAELEVAPSSLEDAFVALTRDRR